MPEPVAQKMKIEDLVVPAEKTFTLESELGAIKCEIIPIKRKVAEDPLEFEVVSRFMQLTDPITGVVLSFPIQDNAYSTTAFMAWVVTRHSRSPGSTVQIAQDVVNAGVDPEGKITNFLGIGHASPADMTNVVVGVDNANMLLANKFFYMLALLAGQEKSTRYQEWGDNRITNYNFVRTMNKFVRGLIEKDMQELFSIGNSGYKTHYEGITQLFNEVFQPTSKKEAKSLESRVFDCTRNFIPMCAGTGFGASLSGRNMAKLIAFMEADPDPTTSRFAQLLRMGLAPDENTKQTLMENEVQYVPEAAGLIRHSTAREDIDQMYTDLKDLLLNQADFQTLLENSDNDITPQVRQDLNILNLNSENGPEEMILVQQIMLLFNISNVDKIRAWIANQKTSTLRKISEIILNRFDDHHEPPRYYQVGARVANISRMSLGEFRDMGRHRSGANFSNLPWLNGRKTNAAAFRNILRQGFIIPEYFTSSKDERMLAYGEGLKQSLNNYYNKLWEIFHKCEQMLDPDMDFGFLANLLPLAHAVPMMMHYNPASELYINSLRVRPGGHINYRVLAWKWAHKNSNTGKLSRRNPVPKVDVDNRHEFFDRS